MTAADIDAVTAIEAQVHHNYQEGQAVFANRFALYPSGCFVCVSKGEPVGYMISHPWKRGEPVALDTAIDAVPGDADCLYIHDLALLAPFRGGGAAQAAVSLSGDIARQLGLKSLAIVAFADALGFWERMGFIPTPLPKGDDIIRKYGPGARYMERRI